MIEGRVGARRLAVPALAVGHDIVESLLPGGHISPFIGSRTLADV